MPPEKDVALLCPCPDAHPTALLISLAGPFYYYFIYNLFERTIGATGIRENHTEAFMALTLVPLLAYCVYIGKNLTKIRFVKTLHYPFMLLTVFFGVSLAGAGAWGGGWMMFIAMGVVPFMALPAIAILLTGIAHDISYLQRYRKQQRDTVPPEP